MSANKTSQQDKIVFVYLGANLPQYALSSLELAHRYSGLDVYLVGNTAIRKDINEDHCSFIEIEDFYDEAEFLEAKKRVTLPHEFRSGFWLRTLERFFVLKQYMQISGEKYFLHAELDQLLFRTDILLDRMRSYNRKGVFVPFHDKQRGVASVLFCNDLEAMKNLIAFASATEPFPNEMMLLAKWGISGGPIHAWPTLQIDPTQSKNAPPEEVMRVPSNITHGVLDGLQLGMWITGMDPRNIPFYGKPRNHFVEEGDGLLRNHELHGLKFQLDHEEGFLTCINTRSESQNRIYNLHAHSKIHPWLTSNGGNLDLLLEWANETRSRTLPGTRLTQLTALGTKLATNLRSNPDRLPSELMRAMNLALQRRPSSFPYISGDTFRSMADYVWEPTRHEFDPQALHDGSIIFCQSNSVGELAHVITKIDKRTLTILLGNSDQNHDLQLAKSLNLNPGVRVFAQNLLESIPNWDVLPIGLENAYISRNGVRSRFEKSRNSDKPENKIFRVLSGFSMWTNPSVRNKAHVDLIQSSVVDVKTSLSAKEHHRVLGEYAFVAAPPGNGFDTHRVWEALYLKTIPVVVDSHLNRRFVEMGLPLVLVKSYEEVKHWDESHLYEIYFEFFQGFESEYLWASSWWDMIRNANKFSA